MLASESAEGTRRRVRVRIGLLRPRGAAPAHPGVVVAAGDLVLAGWPRARFPSQQALAPAPLYFILL